MNLVKCSQNHFYDGDKYPMCPYCNGGVVDSAFGGPAGGPMGYGGSEDTPTMPGVQFGGGSGDTPTMPGVQFGGQGGFGPAGGNPFNMDQGFPTNKTVPGPSFGPFDSDDVPDSSGPFGPVNEEKDDTATVGFYGVGSKSGGVQINPVVGWLVVTEGEEKGLSKNLVVGKNFIGRDTSMDVVIKGDNSVSRIKHAIVLFEPNSRKFIAMPGDAHELFYVNGDVVLNSIELKAYDVLKLGKTELVFMPFCGENFTWVNED
ncbi:FHA domain-containing protein [Eubacterium ruminantium]|nr:FHA domain-containing protein [Eubacterium ruminantium]